MTPWNFIFCRFLPEFFLPLLVLVIRPNDGVNERGSTSWTRKGKKGCYRKREKETDTGTVQEKIVQVQGKKKKRKKKTKRLRTT
ncbi:MAG: hypothetical protein VX367_13175 [SAR324 cluster bacterium]|nr:hypothetical protein [SAR324 cluster bacterium]